MPPGVVDLLGKLGHPLTRGARRFPQQRIGKADDRIQRSAQLMAHRGKKARLGLVRRLRGILGPAQFGLGNPRLGYVGERGDPAAAWGRIRSDIEDTLVRGDDLSQVRFEPVQIGERARAFPPHVAFAEMPTRDEVLQNFILGPPGFKQARWMTQQFGGNRIACEQAVIRSPQQYAVADARQHDRQFLGASRHFRLGLGQRRDIGHHADVAAVGQRGGSHVHRHAVRPSSLARLRARHVECHLLREYLVRIAGTVLTGLGPAPDDRLQMIADIQWRTRHRLVVGAVEHRDPAIRTVHADAVWNGIQN